MTKLFWFSKIGTKDSFSRIAESILPIFKSKGFELSTVIPPNLVLEPENENLFETVLRMGQDIDTPFLKMSHKEFMGPIKENLGSQMKYITLQSLVHCYQHDIKTLFITMGVYEANWFMEAILSIKKLKSINLFSKGLKVVLYVPFDYIPSPDSVEHMVKADLIITTMPYMVDKLKELGANDMTTWVGHGSSSDFKILPQREKLIGLANAMRGRFFEAPQPLSVDDIIVLNANLYGSRKRIEATVDAFNQVSKEFPNLKLWLHGGANAQTVNLVEDKNRLITSSKVKNSELNLIYNICDVGLQTSWGEGWSLTNCEHGKLGKLQVVPDFLACQFHFSEGRGLLVPVDLVNSKNEAGSDVIIGEPRQSEVINQLRESITMFKNFNSENTRKHIKQYTWESEANKMIDILDIFHGLNF